uniref:SH2 domain-containing protein n=1 Tax=Mola mola TaxID=94237 RepID=A0A3Q4AID7_MOLML
MALHPRVVHRRRETITALPLYYSGGLLKKSKKEKKYHAELRGTTLFLYKDFTQDTVSKTLDWLSHLSTIPCKLQMLPGQVLQLQEVLSQEKRRIQLLKTQPPVPPRPSPLNSPPQSEAPADRSNDVPACFFKVTRQKAEHMLEANPEYGGIILRPSSLANNYALTIRQVMPRSDTPPNTVPSLDDIVNYVREKTEYRIHPYMPSQLYDTHIGETRTALTRRLIHKCRAPHSFYVCINRRAPAGT